MDGVVLGILHLSLRPTCTASSLGMCQALQQLLFLTYCLLIAPRLALSSCHPSLEVGCLGAPSPNWPTLFLGK